MPEVMPFESVDKTPTHNTHLCNTVCPQARKTPHALGSNHTDCSVIFVRPKIVQSCVCFMSHPWLFSHPPSSMSTSSSSPIYPTTHREHSVHPADLQAPSPQSGGNPRTTTPTGYEPKELAPVSRIEAYSGDPHQFFDAQERFGEQDHRAPITEEVKEF